MNLAQQIVLGIIIAFFAFLIGVELYKRIKLARREIDDINRDTGGKEEGYNLQQGGFQDTKQIIAKYPKTNAEPDIIGLSNSDGVYRKKRKEQEEVLH